MDISGIGSVYSDYLTSQATSSKTSSLQSKLENVSGDDADDDELMEACKEFESYFIEQVYGEMLETTKLFSDDDEDGYASKMVDYYKDFAIQELSEQTTESGSLGLANILYEQMKRNYGIDTVTPETVSAASSEVETDEDD
jgi:Rod binding domain-containing protein